MLDTTTQDFENEAEREEREAIQAGALLPQQGSQPVECPECQGTGMVGDIPGGDPQRAWDGECGLCDGAGWVEEWEL